MTAEPQRSPHPHPTSLVTLSPFGWGLGRRLGTAAVLAGGLWLAVAWALDWWG